MSLDNVQKLAQRDRSSQNGKKTRYSAETRQAAFDAVKNGASAKDVQRATEVSYPTVISWTKGAKRRKRAPKTALKTRKGAVKLIEVSPKVHASLKTLGVDFKDVTEKEVALRLLG